MKNARHVIATHSLRKDEIICICEFMGNTEEFSKHIKEMKKIGDAERTIGLWKKQSDSKVKSFTGKS